MWCHVCLCSLGTLLHTLHVQRLQCTLHSVSHSQEGKPHSSRIHRLLRKITPPRLPSPRLSIFTSLQEDSSSVACHIALWGSDQLALQQDASIPHYTEMLVPGASLQTLTEGELSVVACRISQGRSNALPKRHVALPHLSQGIECCTDVSWIDVKHSVTLNKAPVARQTLNPHLP